MPNYVQYDKYTQPKEVVRKKIKQALISHNVKSFTSLDANAEILEPIENVVNEFCNNYKVAGGKHIQCNRENFTKYLVDLLKSLRYSSILNTFKSLSSTLSGNGIQCYDSIDASAPVDAAIVMADALIARNGSMVFSQSHSLYPSIKGLAKDIIVIASTNMVVPDLKAAMEVQQRKLDGKLLKMMEIVTPTFHKDVAEYTPDDPRYIMLLLFPQS